MTKSNENRWPWFPRADAEIIGSIGGLAFGLLSPLLPMPPAGTSQGNLLQTLDGLLYERPFFYILAAAGFAALVALLMYVAVAVQARQLRPDMRDRHKPLFFRYWWALPRFIVTTGSWMALGLAAGFCGAVLLAVLGVYSAPPYGYIGFAIATCAAAGTAGLKALQLGQRHPAS